MKAVEEKGLEPYLNTLYKQPSSKLIVKKDVGIEDAEDARLGSPEEREKLITFISNLQANMIPSNKVENIDVRAYEEKIRSLETKSQEALKKIDEERKIREKEREERSNNDNNSFNKDHLSSLQALNLKISKGLNEINDTLRRAYSGDDINTATRAKGKLIGSVEIPVNASTYEIQQAITIAKTRIQNCLDECNDTIKRNYSGDDVNTAGRIKGALNS